MCNRWPIALLMAAVLGPQEAGAQQADYIAGQQIKLAVSDLSKQSTPMEQMQDAGGIMANFGLPWTMPAVPAAPAPAFEPDVSAVVELVDIRLLLTQIAIQTGARDHADLLRAQGDRDHDVILLRGGLATLEDFVQLAHRSMARDFVVDKTDGVVLLLPLAIWSDAGLTLSDHDHLVLDRPSGSFVANLGRFDLSGGGISGSAASNAAVPDFRPFVLTAGKGSFTAQHADFQSLGFGDAAVLGGIAVANNGLVAPRYASSITDSTLNNVRTLGLLGTTGAIVTGNQIIGSGGTAVLISNAMDTVVAGNSLTAASGNQAIRVTAESQKVQITGNLLSGGARIGIVADQKSRSVTIAGNLVLGHPATGIALNGIICAIVSGNLVAANGGNGISATNSNGASIDANAILFNEGAGILVRGQAADAEVWVTKNVLAGNHSGVRGATVGKLTIEGNDLDRQLQRTFTGDLALLEVQRLRVIRDGIPKAVSASASPACPTAGEG